MGTLRESFDLAISFHDVELIEKDASTKQRVELWHHPKLGKILTIDEEVQHVEAWQALYHEPLIHVPAAFVERIDRVLILGGGSLFAAAQVLQYSSVVSCTLVDHDSAVLDLAARHYDHARRVRTDPRFKFVHADMVEFLATTTEAFDLVINDGIDIMRASEQKRVPVHSMMQNHLKPGGVCGDVIYRHIFESAHGQAVRTALEVLGAYVLAPVVVPEYPGVLHLLTIWGKAELSQDRAEPINAEQKAWCTRRNKRLEFYDPRYLRFNLFLPPYIRHTWMTSTTK